MTLEAVICLGSNSLHGRDNISRALDALGNFGPVVCCDVYPSEGGYLNCVCSLYTTHDFHTLYNKTKEIERLLGRLPEHKEQGRVEIDIDIVYFDSQLLRPADARKNYFLKGLNLLNDVKTVDTL